MSHKHYFVILASFSLGVFINSFIDFGWAFALLFIFIGACFLLFFGFSRSKIFLAVGLIAVSFGLGQARYSAQSDFGKTVFLESKISQKIILSGVVTDEPEEKENYSRIVFKEEKTGGKILIYLRHYPEFSYGDKLKITGVLKKPEIFLNNLEASLSNGSEASKFSWTAYLAKEGIYYEMFYPQTEFISSGNGFWAKEKLFLLKSKFLSAISLVAPEPHASFLGGITIGAKESLPKELQEKFRQTGVAHIITLSGYNITIVAESIMLFFGFLPRYLAIGGGMAGIILFAIMTGASATVLRASIMALLVLVAKATGRIYTVSWALFLAGFFMILQNPKILRFDASFQLSFLATLGLIYLAPAVKEKMFFITEKFNLREIFAATVAAQIFVLPLLVFKTGQLSLAGLPVNFLILPFIPSTMLFGFAAGILGMINWFISIPFGWASYALLQYELWVVEVFSRLPFASVATPKFSWLFPVLAYVVLAIFVVVAGFPKKPADD